MYDMRDTVSEDCRQPAMWVMLERNDCEREAAMKMTVVELDLKGYSDIVLELEEHLSAKIVLQLNDQILGFVEAGLQTIGIDRGHAVMATTGDGAILAFERAEDAHRFAVAVHEACRVHNSERTVSLATRWFRIGIATGDLAIEGTGRDRRMGGSVIARAVRLEAAAGIGQILADRQTCDELPNDLLARYGPEEKVPGKREESFAARRSVIMPGLPPEKPAKLWTAGAPRRATNWIPRVCYALQPAPHFHGRNRLHGELLEWIHARGTPERVVSLVAVGGTGKTALAERVLRDLGDQLPFGLLVWSFYENPRTEEFLRTSCEYFTGETPTSSGGLLERLQVALTGDEPHLLVLDGIERVQSEWTPSGEKGRGELEDPQLRRLVRWLAAGQGTRTRALVTSRFPLVDLDDWKHAGHREERLDDLEPTAARAVLRGWGVKGDDATLDVLAARLGYHALSVAVLGSYVGKLWDGDWTKAPTFDRGELTAADPKAAKLSRILMHYAEKLPDAERDLLARLSTFPRGVTIEFLGFLIDAGGQIAGALAGCNEVRLLTLLENLRNLGLVFRYVASQGVVFTAHPFLRDHFGNLLGATKPNEIHEIVRARLVPNLGERPMWRPTDPVILDRYEALIEHTRLAGRNREAFDLYRVLGGGEHLAWGLGDNARGLRILSGFLQQGRPEDASLLEHWDPRQRLELLEDWGWFAFSLGNLVSARRAFAIGVSLSRMTDLIGFNCFYYHVYVELLASRLPEARTIARAALMEADKAGDAFRREQAHCYLGSACVRLGELDNARRYFEAGRAGVDSHRGIWEAEFKLAIGDRVEASKQSRSIQDYAKRVGWTRVKAMCDTLLGLVVLPDDSAAARQHLDAARSYASRSGNIEVQLRGYHLATEIARAERAYELARSEAEAGIHLADTCGFGHYAIELRLALARAQLDAGEANAALTPARAALDRSVHPECQYAWGEADALHLCGVAHARLGDFELAHTRLDSAAVKREYLTHPCVADTRAELGRLGSHLKSTLTESRRAE